MDKDILLAAHERYMGEFQSLNKTCAWLADKHRIQMSRQRLSVEFNKQGLEVLPPNGRPAFYYRPNDYIDGYSELAADMIRAAIQDIQDWAAGKGDLVGYLTGCIFFVSDTYRLCLDLIGRRRGGVEYGLRHVLPAELDHDLVRAGIETYLTLYEYWFVSNDND